MKLACLISNLSFVVFFTLYIVLCFYIFSYGNVEKLYGKYDCSGKICSETSKPFILQTNSYDLNKSISVCVEKCPDVILDDPSAITRFSVLNNASLCYPKLDAKYFSSSPKIDGVYLCPRIPFEKTYALGGFCVPKSLVLNSIEEKGIFFNIQRHYSSYVKSKSNLIYKLNISLGDVILSYKQFLIEISLSIIFSLILVLTHRIGNFNIRLFLQICVTISLAFSLLISIFLLVILVQDEPEKIKQYLSIEDFRLSRFSQSFAISMTILYSILFISVLLYFHFSRREANIMQKFSYFIKDLMEEQVYIQIFMPLINALFLIGWMLLLFFGIIYILSMTYPYYPKNQSNGPCAKMKMSSLTEYGVLPCFVIVTIWFMHYNTAFFQAITTCIVNLWYSAPVPEMNQIFNKYFLSNLISTIFGIIGYHLPILASFEMVFMHPFNFFILPFFSTIMSSHFGYRKIRFHSEKKNYESKMGLTIACWHQISYSHYTYLTFSDSHVPEKGFLSIWRKTSETVGEHTPLLKGNTVKAFNFHLFQANLDVHFRLMKLVVFSTIYSISIFAHLYVTNCESVTLILIIEFVLVMSFTHLTFCHLHTSINSLLVNYCQNEEDNKYNLNSSAEIISPFRHDIIKKEMNRITNLIFCGTYDLDDDQAEYYKMPKNHFIYHSPVKFKTKSGMLLAHPDQLTSGSLMMMTNDTLDEFPLSTNKEKIYSTYI